MSNFEMHIAAFMFSGITSQAWRLPEVQADLSTDIDYFVEYAQTAERGLLDAVFLADVVGGPRQADRVFERLSSSSILEPVTLMSALALKTKNLGLIYTASATYNEPFNVARQAASLDHISKGRAGWNLVTSYGGTPSPNFRNLEVDHKGRYEAAAEFYDVVSGLWDSFEADALVLDKATGIFVDPQKVRSIDFHGKYYSVAGPLNIARSPQGRPIVAQAGSSDAGRELGARAADVLFCNHATLSDAQDYYHDIKQRAVNFGRRPDDIKILPGCAVIWGRTEAEALEKLDRLGALYSTEVALENFGFDVSVYDIDKPFPADIDLSNGTQGHQRAVITFAREQGLTIRQTAQRLAVSSKHRLICGTTAMIADELEQWVSAGGCDGYILLSPYLLHGLRDFVDNVIPELQRRKIFRSEYAGTTLRRNLGVA